jgi:hypothetical protein
MTGTPQARTVTPSGFFAFRTALPFDAILAWDEGEGR